MKKLLLGGIALGAVLAFSGVANAQIKLGVGGPITGPNAAFGAQLKNGAEQAVEDINAAGGVLGQKITVNFEHAGKVVIDGSRVELWPEFGAEGQ